MCSVEKGSPLFWAVGWETIPPGPLIKGQVQGFLKGLTVQVIPLSFQYVDWQEPEASSLSPSWFD